MKRFAFSPISPKNDSHLLNPNSILLHCTLIEFSTPTRKKILQLKNLSIQKNELIFILGKNGAGKSSLLTILAGFVSPDRGEIFWNGNKIKPLKDRLVPGFEGIELVKQEPDLNPFLHVEEQIIKATRHLPSKTGEKKKNDLIKTLRLRPLLSQKTGNLSGGEKRRLGIAMALAKECELLLLDEPFTDLDAENRLLFASILFDLKALSAISIVIVSHFGADALLMADQIWTIDKGQWVEKVKRVSDGIYPHKYLTAKLLGLKNLLSKKENPNLPFPDGSDWISISPDKISYQKSESSIELGTWSLLGIFKQEGGFFGLWKNKNRDQFLESRLPNDKEIFQRGMFSQLYLEI